MGDWIEELAEEMADMIIKEQNEYESYLPMVYNKVSKEDLLKAYSYLEIINEKDYSEQKNCYEMKQLIRLLGYPVWRIGKNKSSVRNYPTNPFVDLMYVSRLLKK
ncbi:MAG: hypothetical protein IJO03_07625 [Clostridia bacterium]|nr:hypothetical protein [Clostridia bacterium]